MSEINYRKDQIPIMNYENGTMAVPAVPGAGKTFIVTNLVAKLLAENKNEKGKILILTYMNSAANNFKGRIKKILEEKGIDSTNGFEVMTIHSLAAKIIKEKYPDVIFNVIGMIDQPHYEKILKKYEEDGVIKYHGFQTDMMPFIEKCNCMINPSYTEGMSNVLLENAACGRPLIASDIPGCKEIIDENINGYVFDVKNTDKLVLKIEKFINIDYSKKVAMGLCGREKVNLEFDREIVINKYIKEIDNIFFNI